MAEKWKLLNEMDKCFKKIDEGVEVFEEMMGKMGEANSDNQRDKQQDDLKKEIKKLQRLREQVKSWQSCSEIKDKKKLDQYRKLIEQRMETFKDVERENKTKPHSKQGLSAEEKLDPREKEKAETLEWLNSQIRNIQYEIDRTESKIESFATPVDTGRKRGKGKDDVKRADKEKVEELKKHLERVKFNWTNLEVCMRLITNEKLEIKEVIDKLKEPLDMYVEALDPENENDPATLETMEPDDVYNELNLGAYISQLGATYNSIDDKKVYKSPPGSPTPDDLPKLRQPSGELQKFTRSKPVGTSAFNTTTAALTSHPISIPATTSTRAFRQTSGENSSIRSPPPPPIRPILSSEAMIAPSTPPMSYSVVASKIKTSVVPTTRPTAVQPTSYAAAARASPPAQQAAETSTPQPPGTPLTVVAAMAAAAIFSFSAPTFGPTTAESTNSGAPLTSPLSALISSPMATPPTYASVAAAGSSTTPPLAMDEPQRPAVDTTRTQRVEAAKLEDKPLLCQNMEEFINRMSPEQLRDFGKTDDPEVPKTRQTSMISLGVLEPAKEMEAHLHMIDAGAGRILVPSETEKRRLGNQMIQPSPCYTAPYYPQKITPNYETLEYYTRLQPETLFFAFYYLEGTKAQLLAAKALKKLSWRYHMKYLEWFRRHQEPDKITDEYERGSYLMFDYEKWTVRKLDNFVFEYKYLEDRDIN